MGPVSQPSQSPSRSCGRGGRAVGDFPVERRGAARAVRLDRRGEGAPGRGALGRAALPRAPGGRLQRQPRRLGAPEAPEECQQVSRGALQGRQSQVQRARQQVRPPQHKQHRESRLQRALTPLDSTGLSETDEFIVCNSLMERPQSARIEPCRGPGSMITASVQAWVDLLLSPPVFFLRCAGTGLP